MKEYKAEIQERHFGKIALEKEDEGGGQSKEEDKTTKEDETSLKEEEEDRGRRMLRVWFMKRMKGRIWGLMMLRIFRIEK